jgi:T5orf172 domain
MEGGMKTPEKKNGLHFQRRHGYVYVVRGYKGFVKVGAAHNVKSRMRQLRMKDQSIQLVASIRCDRFMYLEKFLHVELKENQVANEWYKHETKVLKTIIDFLKSHGTIFGAYEIFFAAPGRSY